MKNISSIARLSLLFSLSGCASSPDAQLNTKPDAAPTADMKPETISKPVFKAPMENAETSAPQVPAVHEAKIGKTVISEPFVSSSLRYVQLADKTRAVIVEMKTGQIQAFHIDAQDNIHSRTIAQHAQLACIEPYLNGYRLGLILRDAQKSKYSLQISAYDGQGNEQPDETWLVTTRGFMPDPGTGCAMLSRRELLAVGTRPRGSNPPQHGLFKVESRALNLYEDTQVHVPEIIQIDKQTDNHYQLLTRQVIRIDGQSPQWPHILYQLGENYTLTPLLQADFIVKTDEQAILMQKDGCIIREDKSTNCPNIALQAVEVRDLTPICGNHDSYCLSVLEKDKQYLMAVPKSSGNPDLRQIESDIRWIPVGNSRDESWLLMKLDSRNKGMANELVWGKM